MTRTGTSGSIRFHPEMGLSRNPGFRAIYHCITIDEAQLRPS